MGRRRPRILGTLRNPPPRTPPPSTCSSCVHLLHSQPSNLQSSLHANLHVFYPTSFPSLKNTSYFPTLMIAMPSSSCLTKLSSKPPARLDPLYNLSPVLATSKGAALDSSLLPTGFCLIFSSLQKNLQC
uniref:Uncharacterized protein n=1 Tax=Nannospalax galili TaxID=1026970 RepID=A0A8C6QCN0_NANGA